MFDITFKFTKEEFVKGYTSHPELKRRVLLMIILGSIILFGGVSVMLINGVETNSLIDYILLLIGLFLLFSGYILKFNSRKFFNSNPSFKEDIHYTFSNKSFSSSGEGYNGEMDWRIVYQVIENRDYFYIYANKSIMYILPKRAFTIEKLQAFREILKAQKDLKKE